MPVYEFSDKTVGMKLGKGIDLQDPTNAKLSPFIDPNPVSPTPPFNAQNTQFRFSIVTNRTTLAQTFSSTFKLQASSFFSDVNASSSFLQDTTFEQGGLQIVLTIRRTFQPNETVNDSFDNLKPEAREIQDNPVLWRQRFGSETITEVARVAALNLHVSISNTRFIDTQQFGLDLSADAGIGAFSGSIDASLREVCKRIVATNNATIAINSIGGIDLPVDLADTIARLNNPTVENKDQVFEDLLRQAQAFIQTVKHDASGVEAFVTSSFDTFLTVPDTPVSFASELEDCFLRFLSLQEKANLCKRIKNDDGKEFSFLTQSQQMGYIGLLKQCNDRLALVRSIGQAKLKNPDADTQPLPDDVDVPSPFPFPSFRITRDTVSSRDGGLHGDVILSNSQGLSGVVIFERQIANTPPGPFALLPPEPVEAQELEGIPHSGKTQKFKLHAISGVGIFEPGEPMRFEFRDATGRVVLRPVFITP